MHLKKLKSIVVAVHNKNKHVGALSGLSGSIFSISDSHDGRRDSSVIFGHLMLLKSSCSQHVFVTLAAKSDSKSSSHI